MSTEQPGRLASPLTDELGPLVVDVIQQVRNAAAGLEAAIRGGSVVAMGDALPEAMREILDAVAALESLREPGWDMPRRKRETLQRRHDYLRSIPHDRRTQYMDAEISALDWVLHRLRPNAGDKRATPRADG